MLLSQQGINMILTPEPIELSALFSATCTQALWSAKQVGLFLLAEVSALDLYPT
jgi:hypothetical protein